MSLTDGQASSTCLNDRWGKIERPPLILTVLGGRTRAHLDIFSQASSHYLNCIGWQDKPTSSIVVGLCLLCCTNCLLAVVVFSSSCLCPVAVMGRVTTSSKCSWGWLIDSWRNGVMTARGPILLERLWFRNSYSGRNQVGAMMGQK